MPAARNLEKHGARVNGSVTLCDALSRGKEREQPNLKSQHVNNFPVPAHLVGKCKRLQALRDRPPGHARGPGAGA